MTISANGLPATRESELRDTLAIIRAGQTDMQMRDGVTLAQCQAYARQAAFLSDAAHKRYRGQKA